MVRIVVIFVPTARTRNRIKGLRFRLDGLQRRPDNKAYNEHNKSDEGFLHFFNLPVRPVSGEYLTEKRKQFRNLF